MAKTITIRDDVYKKLHSAKEKDESFSTLLERLVDTADPLEVLKRLRGTVEFREKKTMLRELALRRAEVRS